MTPVVPDQTAVEPTAEPWPEPWQTRPGSRPRTQYWDVMQACWNCDGAAAGPIPEPRQGD